jgi:hypothetical protein
MRNAVLASVAALLLAGCSSDSPTTPPGPAAQINSVSAPTIVAAGGVAGDSVVARVVDAKGRGVPGVTVGWYTSGGAILSPFEVITDEKGYARTSFRSTGIARDVEVAAAALTTTGTRQATFTVPVVAGPATAFIGLPGGTLSLPLYGQRTLTIGAVDAYLNTVPVTFTSSNTSVVDVTSSGTVTVKAAGTAALGLTAGALQTSVAVSVSNAMISESFDAENGGRAILSFRGFSRWTVNRGDVDLVGAGSEWDFAPGHGLYVDLDGYYNGGLFVTRDQFILPAGSYTLSFKLAGSQRGDSNTVTVSVGSAFSEQFTVGSAATFTAISRTITLAQPATVRVSFDQPGSDGYGALLDDVSFTRN